MANTFQVAWTRTAVRDLEELLDDVAADRGADQARRTYEHLRRAIASLTTMPRRCRQVPELRDLGLAEYREVVDRPYRLVFRIVDRQVVILAVLDSRRDLEELLVQRALEG